MKKVWSNPRLHVLGVSRTEENGQEYVNWCNWSGIMPLKDYKDPTKPPTEDSKKDWVWCTFHSMWHPKNHTQEVVVGPGNGGADSGGVTTS